MQLISEIEPHNRGAYGGDVSALLVSVETSIKPLSSGLSSAVMANFGSRPLGVVAKSNDEYELEESNNKLGALVKAIRMAEKL